MLHRRLALWLGVAVGAAAAIGVLLRATASGLAALNPGAVTSDDIVGLGALVGVWIAVLWLAAGFGVALIAAIPSRRSASWERAAIRLAPTAVRHLAGRLVVGATLATCAAAIPSVTAAAEVTPPALPDLDRPTATANPASAQPESPASENTDLPGSDIVVVAPGDNLWNISAARLPPGASNAEIATEWPRWYARNRAVIGADPDMIFPGQHLHAPGGQAS